MPSADLELVIAQLLDGRTTVSLRAELSNSRSEPVAGEPINIDLNLLRSLSHIPSAYGPALTDMVFVPKVREGWRQARGYQQADDAPQRVRLVLDGDSALHALRWELLHDPIDQAPLAYSERVTFSRFLAPVGFHDPTTSKKLDLRAVVAVANPAGTVMPPVDVQGEVARAQTGLGGLHVTVLDGQEGRLRATLPALLDALRQDEPDLLYLVCHGSLDEDGPWLWLEQEEAGSYQPVAGQEFIQAVTRPLRRPLLVILASCQSAGDNYEALASIGPRLAREGIGAVLAMQGRVPQTLVAGLMPRLFHELRRHGRIDQALAVARSSLTREQPWWMPTLWMAVRDGRLWREAEVEPLGNAYQRLQAMPLDQVPEVAPLPIPHRMPFASNPLFVGRADDLKALAVALKGQQTVAISQIAAATGLGGIGKTSLAVEFAHRYGQFFTGGVFWLSCADPAGVDTEIAACGQAMNLPSFAELKLDDQVQRVKQLWQEPTPRLLVLDNCEDEEVLARLRPTSGGCRVLVTSRRSVWSTTLGVKSHVLGVLDRAESIRLLQRFRPTLTTDEANAVAEAVGDLPLALHLAGSYLGRYESMSAGEYVTRLGEALLAHPSLEGRGAERSPTEHELHVARTFAVSFDQLDVGNQIGKIARDVLTRAACLAPGIPIARRILLLSTINRLKIPEDDQVILFEDGVRRLLELGLLEATSDHYLIIHKLLAIFVGNVMSIEEIRPSVELALRLFFDYQRDDAGYIVPAEGLLQHLTKVTYDAMTRSDESSAMLANKTGYYLFQRGDIETAKTCFQHALTVREVVLGPEHRDTAQSLHNLGTLLAELADPQVALPYLDKALAVRKKILGLAHPDTSTSLNSLGVLLQALGRLAEAQSCFETALSIRVSEIGEDSLETAVTMNHLGSVLQEQHDLAGAQYYFEQALNIRLKELGSNHVATAASFNSLATLFYEKRELEQAAIYSRQALEVFMGQIGPESTRTATALNNLAIVLRETGELNEAKKLVVKGLEIRLRRLGHLHADTGYSCYILAMILHEQGEEAEARAYYEQALEALKPKYPRNHPLIQSIHEHLALTAE